MAAMTLEAVCGEFAQAVNAGDLDALCALYAPDAAFVTGPGASPAVSGSAAVREVLAGFLASRPKMEFTHVFIYQSGDTAVARGEWKLTSVLADGSEQTAGGSSVEVLRRQADGSWLYILDHPWGAM